MPAADRRLTVLCWLAMLSLAMGINLLPVFLTDISVAFGGLSNEQLGRLTAIGFAGLCAAIALTGPLADRWGAKPFALAGNALVAVGLVGLALAPDYGWLCAAAAVLGAGAGTLDMVLSPIVAALHPDDRSAAMNKLHAFYCVGAALTVGAGMIAQLAGFGLAGGCVALLPLPLALLAAFAPLRFPALVAGPARTALARLFATPFFWLATAAILLGGATELGLAQWLPAYAERTLGFAPWMGALALLLFSLAMGLGRWVVGWLPLPPTTLMAWGCATSIALFLAGAFLPQRELALTACILAGFTGSCLWPTMLAVAADRFPAGGASLFGLLAAAGNAGGIAMPWLVGVVADRSDLRWGLATSALAPLLMLPLVLRLRR